VLHRRNETNDGIFCLLQVPTNMATANGTTEEKIGHTVTRCSARACIMEEQPNKQLQRMLSTDTRLHSLVDNTTMSKNDVAIIWF